MTNWIKCLKLSTLFIASALLFNYFAKCEDHFGRLHHRSELHIESDGNQNILDSKEIKYENVYDGSIPTVSGRDVTDKIKPKNIEVINKESINDLHSDKYIKKEDNENAQPQNLSNQESDSIPNDDNQNSQEFEEYDDYNIVEENIESDYTGHRLPDCSEKLDIRKPILIVSTIDGQISGINYETGEVVWSHSTSSNGDPMLSSSMSKLEVASRGEWVRLIPSLSGGIYRFDGELVEALPVTADTFLHSSFKFSDDTIFSGGKFLEILGLHPQTGEIKYMCDKNGCPSNPSTGDNKPTLVVRRVSYTVRAVDPSAGMERWNFSVGQNEVNFAIGDCESLMTNVNLEDLPFLHFILPEGNIVAMNKDSEVLWQQKLPSPIISAWSLINEELEQVNLFSSTSIPALVPEDRTDDAVDGNREPALYVGIHRGQLYVQENKNLKPEFGSIVQMYANTNLIGTGLAKVQWQPYLATAVSRTPVIHHGAKNHPLLLDYDKKEQTNELVVRHTHDYPYDNGYYLFGDDFDLLLNESDHWINEELGENIPHLSRSYLHHLYDHIMEGEVYFWAVMSSIVVVFLHLIFVRHMVANSIRNAQARINDVVIFMVAHILYNIFRENAQVVLIIQRLGLNIAPLPPPPPPPPPPSSSPAVPDNLPPELDDGLQVLPAADAQRQDSCFSSRYESDFEPISRIGKGGFGVVFHVKNKLDESEYAVKRILLPSKESSAERVKREARALAKLDHTNIVRYYTSWLETPPVGWEEAADLWWKRSETLSPSLEDEYSEQPFSADTGHPQSQPDVRKDLSLSAVINKLTKFNLPINDESSPKYLEEISDDNEGEDYDDSINEQLSHSYNNYDDSSGGIVFEEPEEDQEEVESSVSKNTAKSVERNDYSKLTYIKKESSQSDSSSLGGRNIDDSHSESIVFESNITESTHGDSIIFASRSEDSTQSDSIVFASTSNDKEKGESKRIKSSSFSISSSPKSQSLRRRRLYTHTGLTDQRSRPSSLVLKDFQKSSLNQKEEEKSSKNLHPCSPNPRTYLYIQMELCQQNSLKEWLLNNKSRDSRHLYSIFNDIVHAVEYVHDRSLMHRDLKPSNIFFSLEGRIKIGDFGLVTTIDDEHDAVTPVIDHATEPRTSLGQRQKTLNVGTTLYMSPEQFSGRSYTYKVDIFSLGLIFFEMLVPFSTDMERIDVMRKSREKQFPPHFTSTYPDVESLLQLALHRDPNERPTTSGIRARQPLESLQKDLENISEGEHFHLTRPKGHSRTSSGSFSFMQSVSVST